MMRLIATTALCGALASAATAQNYEISVWVPGPSEGDRYRWAAIEMAADILEREAAIRGKELTIAFDYKSDFPGWAEFKQAVTLAAEAKDAPEIIVTSHLDIAPWSQAGYIVPVEDYLDLDAWPISDIYPNLMEIASVGGVQWAIPQDSESRPFFFWRAHMRAIGYTDAQIDALPDAVLKGEYTLKNVLEDAKKVVEAGLVEEGKGFFPRPSNGPDYAQFYQSFGGTLYDADTGQLVLDRAAMTAFYQFFVDAVAAGVTSRTHIGSDWDNWYAEVSNGRAAMWHGGTWHYGRYVKEGNTDFFGTVAFTLIPAGGNEGGRANTITHPLVYLVTDQGDEKVQDIAAQLIAIASEPRINSLHAIASAHLSITKSQSGVPLYAQDAWATAATQLLLPHANSQPNHPQYSVYSEAMWKGLESAWTGTQTPEAAVAALEAELSAVLGDALIVR